MFVHSQANSAQGLKCNDKIPQVNWLQHANAHDNFSCQAKFLSSNFLFSVPTNKPSNEGAASGRYAFYCNDLFLFILVQLQHDAAIFTISCMAF